MPANANRLVKFLGGPCDGLECRDDSADRFESSIAIVWSLFRIGCGGPLCAPETLTRREVRRQRSPQVALAPANAGDDAPAAHYRVIRRMLQGGVLVSIAWHAPPQGSRP
jgi:hypothetical protein